MTDVRITLYSIDTGFEITIPLIMEKLQAGFPSPAQNCIEKRIDLNKILIHHPDNTFFGKVEGLSLKNIGIETDDRVLIDRVYTPENGDLILATLDGEFTLKLLEIGKNKEKLLLHPANPDYPPLIVNEFTNFDVFGVITFSITKQIKRFSWDAWTRGL